ncbi:hypothetical protein OAJ38_04435 [Rhodobiaceae bacterium]|nr:hypothetical protein [Rhodobiaceae bacterium]
MRVVKRLSLLTMTIFLCSCASTSNLPTMTPMEIQSLQTREYEENKEIVFRSVVSVFQDIGYIISQADLNSGLITATGAADSDWASKFWLGVTKVTQTKATAFIERIGDFTRVRVNFVTSRTEDSIYGQSDRSDEIILDIKAYESAFEKIEQSIFVRSATN